MLTLYNTLTRQKETFIPQTPGYVGVYVCGPTVYSDPHLGHARGPIAYDVLRNWLEFQGNQVRFVSNITDVGHLVDEQAGEGEDRIQRRARLERLEPMEVAEKYMWSYFDAMQALGVRRPSIAPRAAGHIPEQIALTQRLLQRGHAYAVNGSVYFRVRSWPSFGKLANRQVEDQEAGARVAVREEKEDPRDFALWKQADPEHLMRWESPWGEGFPGWHIECSAMSLKYLGENFDLHAGGIDLQFPHHECEIAQAEAAGYRFARYWLHHNHVLLNGEKMAKSTGNLVLLHQLLAAHEPMVLRFYLLQSHYRSVLDFTDGGLEAARNGYARLLHTYRELTYLQEKSLPGVTPALEQALQTFRQQFTTALDDDLNTARALAAFFELSSEVHRASSQPVGQQSLEAVRQVFQQYGQGVLGLFPERVLQANLGGDLLEGLVNLLIELRQQARENRNFAQADTIRQRLAELGILLEDTRQGIKWRLAQASPASN